MLFQYPQFSGDPTTYPDYSAISNLIPNFYKGYELGGTPKKLQQEAMQRALQNQISKANADVAVPMAQAGLTGAQLGNKISAYNLENMPAEEKLKLAQMQANLAQTQTQTSSTKADLLQKNQQLKMIAALSDAISGNGQTTTQQQPTTQIPQATSMEPTGVPYRLPSSQPVGAAQQGTSLTQPIYNAISQQQPNSQAQSQNGDSSQQPVVLSPGNPNLYHIDDALDQNPLYTKALESYGISGKTQKTVTNDKTGQTQLITTYPSGKMVSTNIQTGMTPEDIQFGKGMGQNEADAYKDAQTEYTNLQKTGSDLDGLVDVMDNNPEFKNVTGPVSGLSSTYFGNLNQKDLSGMIQNMTGDILLATQQTLKGSTSNSDVRFIKSLKPNITDPAAVFYGKTKAMKIINEMNQDRSFLRAKYISQKVTPLEAAKRAAAETPYSKYQSKVEAAMTDAYINLAKDPKLKNQTIPMYFKGDRSSRAVPLSDIKLVLTQGAHYG